MSNICKYCGRDKGHYEECPYCNRWFCKECGYLLSSIEEGVCRFCMHEEEFLKYFRSVSTHRQGIIKNKIIDNMKLDWKGDEK